MIQRNYWHLGENLRRLEGDIYAQPPDSGHEAWGKAAITWALALMGEDKPRSVLDVGCGQAPFLTHFQESGVGWAGVTIGADFEALRYQGLSVYEADMTFLPFADRAVDMIFARHALEHSPLPLMTLMEWKRLARKWMLLILPTPEYWGVRGRNHYSVLPRENWGWLLERSGWRVEQEAALRTPDALYRENIAVPVPDDRTVEWWLLCSPMDEVIE